MEETSCLLAKRIEKNQREGCGKGLVPQTGRQMRRWEQQMRDVVIREHDSGGIITDTG